MRVRLIQATLVVCLAAAAATCRPLEARHSNGSRNATNSSARQLDQFGLEDEAIVMNSVHAAAGKRAHRPQAGPQQRPQLGKREPSDAQGAGPPARQSGPNWSQPSQEFESQSLGARSSGSPNQATTAGRWPSRPQAKPVRDFYGASAAPYALGQAAQSGAGLIRDVSELQANMVSSEAQVSKDAGASQTWMQSMRDNHHGPIRSRFNLSSQQVAGGAHLSDGHMKAKAGAGQLVPYEQQAKSVREQPSPTGAEYPQQSTTAQYANSSRRNSKFTRRQSDTTTPLSREQPASPTVTANQHAPGAQLRPRPQLGQPGQADSELATGSGQVVALAETDLLLLSQKMENASADHRATKRIDSAPEAGDSRGSKVDKGEVAPSEQSIKTDPSGQILMLSNNHRSSQVRPAKRRHTKAGRRLFGADEHDEAGLRQDRRPWPRLGAVLPAILQRTLSGVLKRLTSGGPQQAVRGPSSPQPVFGHQFPAAGLNFLGSALTAAAAASAPRPAALDLLEPSVSASSASLEQQVAAPPRQHANKKIIDSLVDLPVSERRIAKLEKRDGRSDWKSADEEEPDYEEQSAAAAEPVADGDQADEPEEEPQAESAGPKQQVAEPELVYRSGAGEELDTADSELVEERLYNVAHELGELEPVYAADELEEPVFYYSPAAAQFSRPSRRQYELRRHRPQTRRPSDQSGLEDEEPAEEIADSRSRPTRRRKPVPQRGRKPAHGQHQAASPQVPPISLQAARPNRKPANSQAAKPVSVFTAPAQAGGAEGASNMMSPMSSSINVMDLDPSMTRLAHNKLIVAKFAPKRYKPKPKVASSTTRRAGQLSTAPTSTMAPSRSSARPSTESSVRLSSTRKPQDSANLASAILGNQVISSNHINDILSRWTRPPTGASTVRPSPDNDLNNSSRRLPDPALGLRIMGDIHSLVPFASGLAARFSGAPHRSPSGSRDAPPSSAGPTSATQAPQRPTNESVSHESSPAPSQSYGGSKNDKFNFSLISMNNRERINPLLYPVESMHKSNAINSTQLNKKLSSSRTRLTSTSTTTTPTPTTTTTTTTTTSTTSRPTRTASTSPRPTAARPAVSSKAPVASTTDESEFGQTLRSQHHSVTKPVGRPNAEYERLRNQYYSLIGKNGSSLFGRGSGAQGPQLAAAAGPTSAWTTGDLSGHITLVTSNLLSGEAGGPSVEEAAYDANKYLTLAAEHSSSTPSGKPAPADGLSEHSIVIMSDNHHQLRRRPASGFTRPLMFYSSTSAAEETATPPSLPANFPATLNPAQIARKYLEEFVNGSRVRPSSAMAAKSTTIEPRMETTKQVEQKQQVAESRRPSSANGTGEAPQTVITNHSRLSGEAQKRPAVAGNKIAQNSASVDEKLDEKAQEMLLDIFDRDPSYSDSLFSLGATNKSENLRKIYGLAEEKGFTKSSTRYDFSDNVQLKPSAQSTSTTTTDQTRAQSSTTQSSIESKNDLIADLDTTPSNLERTTVQYDSEPRSTSARDYTTSTVTSSTLAFEEPERRSSVAEPTGDASDSNNRASMRRNQAKIQAILMAIAKKNNGTKTTTSEPDELDLEASSPYFASPTLTSAEDNSRDMPTSYSREPTDEPESQETTKFYAPIKLTTAAQPISATSASSATTSGQRQYPNVETLSSSRQKINRPATFSESSDYSQYSSATTPPAMPQSTTKLTESLTNDDQLKQIIRSRATGKPNYSRPTPITVQPTSGSATLEAASEPSDQLTDLSSNSIASELDNRGDSRRQQVATSEEPPQDEESSEAQQYPNEIGEYSRRPLRPVIIRRRPRPPLRRPAGNNAGLSELPHRITVTSDYDEPRPVHKKRKRRPTKRPEADSVEPTSQANNLFDEPTNQPTANNGTYEDNSSSMDSVQQKPQKLKPSIIYRPHASSSSGLIRKRPTYVRLPPDNIRIQGYNKSINKKNPLTAPVSIILPIESVIKRKTQDIRTRPLTIIDPASEQSADNDSLVNPLGLTRIPETTIMHDKMVVTYKPGRPLPGSMSGFGSHIEYTPPAVSRRPPTTEPSELSDGYGSTTPTSQPSTSDYNGAGSLPQLGSGNGGDTHLVPIEQTSRRPINQEPVSSTSQQTEAPPPSSPSYPSLIPHRPIIVINGLFDQNNHSHPFDSKHESKPHQDNSHHHNHKPHRPNSSSGSSLIEAGSLSVVAHASHGQNSNSSRPWYPTSTSSSVQGNRYNTSSTSGPSQQQGSMGHQGNATSSESDFNSNQTADSVIGPEIPNFGGASSGSSGFAVNGNYQNHNQQQTNHQHIGMPYLGTGGTLSNGSRPNQQRPYRWRVKKRPNGSSSTSTNSANYDYSTSSSSSNYVYRPFSTSMQHFFSLNTLISAYDNVIIFFARLRTFLISLMVMFLPPLALAASVANAMSS